MRVDIEKRHIDSYTRIASEANKAVKRAAKIKKPKYEQALLQKDISAENKKKNLVKSLHNAIISAFSLDIRQIKNKKKELEALKKNTALIRLIIHKLNSINSYIEESLLKELGIIKRSLTVKAIASVNPARYVEKNSSLLPKGYIDKVEHTVYELIQKVIFFDKRLLKGYKKKEICIIQTEKLGAKDLEKILGAENEILGIMEAKMPPAGKVKAKLFQKEIFNLWVPMVFALLSSFEAECSKEFEVFSKVKKNNNSRKKIEKRISHIINEKEKLLKIKEKRALAMRSFGKIRDDHRQAFHEYVSAANL